MAKHVLSMTESEMNMRRIIVALMHDLARREGWMHAEVDYVERTLMRQPRYTLCEEFAHFESRVQRTNGWAHG